MRKRILRKRILSVLMVFAIVCSGLSLSPAAQPKTVKATESEETEEEYTPITNASELYAIRNNLSGKYRLMNDIDLTEATAPGGAYDTGNGWTPIEGRFSGVFDGNGHRIIGMQIYGIVPEGDYYGATHIGLFSDNSGRICNLGLIDVNIHADNKDSYTGAITGINSGTIDNCYTTGKIVGGLSGIQSTAYLGGGIGGFCGQGSGTITNCYNGINITCTTDHKGFCGGITGSIDYSYPRLISTYNIGMICDGDGYALDSAEGYGEYIYFLIGTGRSARNNPNYPNPSVPLTEAQLRNKNFLTGLDFENTWYIDPYCNYKYPQLKACPQIRIDSLEIIAPPSKTEYDQGEKLNITGATARIIYEDKLEQEILLTEDMLGDYDMNKIGEQSIPIIWGNATTSFDITVNAIPVTGVKINKSSTSIYKGYTEQLSASVQPETATYKKIEWSSADETIAIVSQDGTVTGKNPGTTAIRAISQDGVMAECKVTVTVPSVILQLDAYDITINKGDTYVPTYKLSPVDSTDTVKWTSSNETVVHIDDKNQLIGVGAGVVTVTGVTGSGISAIFTVTVMQDLSEFTVLNIKDVEYTGKALTQKPTVTNGTKTLRASVDYTMEYSSNVNVGKATIKIIGLGSYKGTLMREFNILPANTVLLPKATISSIKASKKKLIIQWKRVANASGYKIEIAKNRSFTKGKKVYTEGKNTLKKTFKGTKKTTYYIRVQAYAYNGDGRISYGKFSSVKKKKTK